VSDKPKVGDRVKCICNKHISNVTVGKIYEVTKTNSVCFDVDVDAGYSYGFCFDRIGDEFEIVFEIVKDAKDNDWVAELKVGDRLECLKDGAGGFSDAAYKVGNIYEVKKIDSDGDFKLSNSINDGGYLMMKGELLTDFKPAHSPAVIEDDWEPKEGMTLLCLSDCGGDPGKRIWLRGNEYEIIDGTKEYGVALTVESEDLRPWSNPIEETMDKHCFKPVEEKPLTDSEIFARDHVGVKVVYSNWIAGLYFIHDGKKTATGLFTGVNQDGEANSYNFTPISCWSRYEEPKEDWVAKKGDWFECVEKPFHPVGDHYKVGGRYEVADSTEKLITFEDYFGKTKSTAEEWTVLVRNNRTCFKPCEKPGEKEEEVIEGWVKVLKVG